MGVMGVPSRSGQGELPLAAGFSGSHCATEMLLCQVRPVVLQVWWAKLTCGRRGRPTQSVRICENGECTARLMDL